LGKGGKWLSIKMQQLQFFSHSFIQQTYSPSSNRDYVPPPRMMINFTLSRMIIILNPTQLMVKSCLFSTNQEFSNIFPPKNFASYHHSLFFLNISVFATYRSTVATPICWWHQPPNTFATISLFRKEKTPDLLNTFKNIVAYIIKPSFPSKHLKVMMYLKQKPDS
jgi:hypothetical protein